MKVHNIYTHTLIPTNPSTATARATRAAQIWISVRVEDRNIDPLVAPETITPK